MSPTLLERPSATAPPPPREPRTDPSRPDDLRIARRGRIERRSRALGVAGTLVAHVMLYVVLKLTVLGPPDGRPGAGAAPSPEASGTHVVQLRVLEDVPPAPEETDPAAPRAALPVAPRVAPGAPAETDEVAEPGTLPGPGPAGPAERLRPQDRDPRLWALPDELPPPDVATQARELLYARLRALNDSLVAEGEVARRSTDWTFTDKDGRRWGISPEGIHLGGITLPAPSFAPPPGRRGEIDRRTREWEEIENQAGRAARDRERDRAADSTRARGQGGREGGDEGGNEGGEDSA